VKKLVGIVLFLTSLVVSPAKATLVIAIDMEKSETIANKINGFVAKQDGIKNELFKTNLGFKDRHIKPVTHPHITLFCDIDESKKTMVMAVIKMAIEEFLQKSSPRKSLYKIYVTPQKKLSLWGSPSRSHPFFYLGYKTNVRFHPKQTNKFSTLIDLIEKKLKLHGIKSYRRISNYHLSIVELHSLSLSQAYWRKKVLKNNYLLKSFPFFFQLPTHSHTVGSAVWVKGISLYTCKRPNKGKDPHEFKEVQKYNI